MIMGPKGARKCDNFEDFMVSAFNGVVGKCHYRYNKSLTEPFKVSASTLSVVRAIIDKGWWILVALVVVLSLSYIGFGPAAIAFVTTPAGIIVLGILAACGVGGMKALYKERVLPIVVKEVGDYYKSDFNNHQNDISHIDSLIDRASERLLNRAIGRS